jgi:hypothetical protein
MPEDNFDNTDILFERIMMLRKIYMGLEQLDRGESISLEQLEKEMKEWDN